MSPIGNKLSFRYQHLFQLSSTTTIRHSQIVCHISICFQVLGVTQVKEFLSLAASVSFYFHISEIIDIKHLPFLPLAFDQWVRNMVHEWVLSVDRANLAFDSTRSSWWSNITYGVQLWSSMNCSGNREVLVWFILKSHVGIGLFCAPIALTTREDHAFFTRLSCQRIRHIFCAPYILKIGQHNAYMWKGRRCGDWCGLSGISAYFRILQPRGIRYLYQIPRVGAAITSLLELYILRHGSDRKRNEEFCLLTLIRSNIGTNVRQHMVPLYQLRPSGTSSQLCNG